MGWVGPQMAKVQRDLYKSSNPILLSWAGTSFTASSATALSSRIFKFSQNRDFTRCPGTTSQVSVFPWTSSLVSHVYLPTYGFQPLSLVTLPGTTEKSLLSGYWKYSITLPWHFNQIALSHLLSQFHKLFITHNPGSFLTFHFFYMLSDLEARKEALSSQSSESCQILRCNTAWHYRFSYTSFPPLAGQRGFYFFTSTPSNYWLNCRVATSPYLKGKAYYLRLQVLSHVKPYLYRL